MDVVAAKNIYLGTGKDMQLLALAGTKGKVVNKYEWGPHKYVVVQFANKKQIEFGDETHPLVSYKGFIRVV